MARERPWLATMNGGLVSPLALARIDLQRMRFTADVFNNCLPKTIGPLQFRPGLRYLSTTPSNNVARKLPFIFSVDDTALIELSDNEMRVLVDNEAITRIAVATTIPNGDFSSSTGWTVTLTDGAVGDINGINANKLVLRATARGSEATALRSFTVASDDQNVEHAVRVTVSRGTVKFRLGSTSGGNEYIGELALGPGVHSLAFTPTSGTAYVQFSTKSETYVKVDSVQIEGAGEMTFDTPWDDDDLWSLRYQQSGDVIFVTETGAAPRRIERHNENGDGRSWSLVIYQSEIGPWRGKSSDVTLNPSVKTGNGTMSASAPFFDSGHVGALFQLTYTKTTSHVTLAGSDTFTDWVRVSGAGGTTRVISASASGTWSGTLSLETGSAEDGPWHATSTSSGNFAGSDPFGTDNEILYMRMGFEAGDYTSGVASATVSTDGGGGSGVVRVTGYNSPTSVDIEVIERLHYDAETENWQEGKYSDYRGWPASVELFEGRLWFGGRDQLAGSFSDDFVNFDVNEDGDSAPIIRSIATGPVNKVQWLLGLGRLVIGTSGAESVARSNSFDEPMTATNFSIKDTSTYGSADIQAVKIDKSGIFVGRSGNRAYEVAYSVDAQDYIAREITRYNQTILAAGVKVMAVQRNPDTRVWFVLNDGTGVVLTRDSAEDVLALSTFDTDGNFEDVCILPNVDSDDVHFTVKRTINGSHYRFRERLAYETQAQGDEANYMADSFVTAIGPGLTISAPHLEGEELVVWADGLPVLDDNGDAKLFTVSGGLATLDTAFTSSAIAGLPYEGRWRSTKLAYAAQTGTAMSQKKTITSVFPLLYKTHNQAIRFGQDFDNMNPLPRVINGSDVGANAMLDDYDNDAFSIPGKWTNDARICMKFRSPMPATVLGIGLGIESHERG